MPSRPGPVVAALVWCAWLGPRPALGQPDALALEIGDPARRTRTISAAVDTIVDARSGGAVTPDEMARALAGVRLLLVGEQHTSREAHRVQRRTIEALVAAGRTVLVGLEMFPYTEQAALDRWIAGTEAESAWIESAGWYEHWGYHWGYYRDIFRLARDHKLRMVALNAPRDLVGAVGRKGLNGLTPEEAKQLPPHLDVDDAEHLALFKALVGTGGGSGAHAAALSDDQWRRMLSAQVTWDATMAHHALRALAAEPDPAAVMVVLVGSGHVAYGLGIERQARPRLPGPAASIIPVVVQAHGGTPPAVRASYATFIWGVPEELAPAHPTLGVSTRRGDAGQLVVLAVETGTPASAAGLRPGDVLTQFDGAALPDRATLAARVAAKDWGDVANLGITRDGKAQTIRVPLKRSLPRPAP